MEAECIMERKVNSTVGKRVNNCIKFIQILC